MRKRGAEGMLLSYWSSAVCGRFAGDAGDSAGTAGGVVMSLQNKETAEKLRRCRESCALSQQQVADALNIVRSTYTKYESGKSRPNLNTIVKLAAIYNISPEELLPLEEAESENVSRLRDSLRADSPIYQLSKDERGLIAGYRALSREDKKLAREMIGKLSKKEKN